VLTSITGISFAEAHARRINVTLGDLVVPFISFGDLIKNKESTGRGKDRVDADALRKRGSQ